MSTTSPFLEAKPLSHVLAHLSTLPEWSWLYVAAELTEINSETPCHATAEPASDLSDEEYDAREAFAAENGLRLFLSRAQLQEIAANLGAQCQSYNTQQLAAAVSFYWKHDAFVDLSADAA